MDPNWVEAEARRAALAHGGADNGNINAARAGAPAVLQPNIQARGAVGVHIHQPAPPDLALEFLSLLPDENSRSSVAELGSPAYLWPSVDRPRPAQ